MPKGNNPKDIGLNGGKGDADRSPGWRDHYDEIEWPHDVQFIQRGAKQIKRYGNQNKNSV